MPDISERIKALEVGALKIKKTLSAVYYEVSSVKAKYFFYGTIFGVIASVAIQIYILAN